MGKTTRSKMINEYIRLNALAGLLHEIAFICPNETGGNIPAPEGALLAELWPDEKDTEWATATPEFVIAEARSCALAAAMLSRLASHEGREALLAEAARLAAFASGQLGELAARREL
jgi:hypothetical protein